MQPESSDRSDRKLQENGLLIHVEFPSQNHLRLNQTSNNFGRVSFIRSRNYLPFVNTRIHPRFFGGVFAAHLFSFLCCAVMCLQVLIFFIVMSVTIFSQKLYSVRLYFQLFVERLISYLRFIYMCVCLHIVVSNTYCVVFFFLLCTLCCQFL